MHDIWCTWPFQGSQGNSARSKDLPDAGGVASYVVVEGRFAQLERGQRGHLLRIERDAETRLGRDLDAAALDGDGLVEDVLELQRVVRVVREREVRRRRREVRVGRGRDAELGPAADRAPLSG